MLAARAGGLREAGTVFPKGLSTHHLLTTKALRSAKCLPQPQTVYSGRHRDNTI